MLDFACGYFHNNKHKIGRFKDLDIGQKALLCSVVRPVDETSFSYVKYLHGFVERGEVDCLVLCDAYNEKWIHACHGGHKNIYTIDDHNEELIRYVNHQYVKTNNFIKLKKFGSFQILIQDREITNFFMQPLAPNWSDFFSSESVKDYMRSINPGERAMLKIKKKKLVKKFLEGSNEPEAFWNPTYISDHLMLDKKRRHPKPLKILGRYFQIWPNVELEKILTK